MCDFVFIVTENQSQSVVTPPQVAAKPSSTPFGISAQPFNRLGWNPDIKAKQEEVRWYLNLYIMYVCTLFVSTLDIGIKIIVNYIYMSVKQTLFSEITICMQTLAIMCGFIITYNIIKL